MPGIRIDVNTSGAQANTKALWDELRRLGEQGKLTEREVKELGARLAGMEADMKKASTAARATGSAMDTLTTAAKYAAAAFATFKIADYIRESAVLAARYETLGVTMETVGRNAGYTAAQVNYVATALQKTGISMLESREQVAKLIQAHIDLAKATDLARLAQDAAVVAGLNSSETFSRLVYGIQSGQKETLATIGLNVDFEASYKSLANQLNKNKDQLTEHDKVQARFNATMARAPDIAGNYTNAMKTAGKAITSLPRYEQDLQLKFGQAFGPATKTLVDAYSESLLRMQEIVTRPEIQAALQNIANLLAGAIAKGMTFISDWLAQNGGRLPEMAYSAATGFAQLARDIASAVSALGKFLDQFSSIPPEVLVVLGAAAAGGLAAGPWGALGAAGLAAVTMGNMSNQRSVEEGLTRGAASAAGGTNEVRMPVNKTVLGEPQKPLDLTPSKVREAEKVADDLTKGAARFAEQASAFLDNITAGIEQLQDSLTGGTQKESLRIDKWFEQQFDAISKAVVDAKGDVSAYKEAWVDLEQAWPGLKILAVTKDTTAALRQQADILSDIAEASDNPALKEQAGAREIETWYAERVQQIKNLSLATEEESTLMGQLEQARASKMVQNTRDAYESMSAVSQKYWDAEKALIEQKLSVVKESADDELAYKIYAAQEWDDFNRRKLEAQANAPRSQGEAIHAVFALDSGSYKSQMGQLQDSWKSTADGMLALTNDLSSGIAQSLGDALRGIAQGDFESFETIFRSMLLRMADAFISFSEDMLAQALKGGLSSLFQGGGSTAGTGAASGGGGLMGLFGGLVEPAASALFQGGASAIGAGAAGAGGLFGGVSAHVGQSASGLMGAAGAAASSFSWMPVIGAAVGVGLSLLGSLFGQEEEEEPPQEAWSGRSYMYQGGVMSGIDVTTMSDGSTQYAMSDPMEMEEERKRFKSTVKDLNAAMKTLEIDFNPNWERNFSFQAFGVPDALKGILERNMKDSAAAQAMGNVSWTANLFKEGLESLDETVRRLATAFGAVQPLIGPLGIDFEKMGGVTEGVLLAFASMATGFSSGAAIVTNAMLDGAESAEELAERFAAAGESGQVVLNYLEQYRKQISNMILASYSEQLIDSVGGDDAFQQAMTVFSNYAMGDKERATASVNYSRSQFQEGLSSITTLLPNFNQDWIGDNTDAFWAAYAAAMGESMPPSVFDEWATIAQHVANLEDSLQDLADIEFAEWAWDEELKYRRQVAAEQTTGAEITRWSISMEQELADARKNGASYAQQAALVETQIYEMQAKLAKLQGTDVEPQDMESVIDRLGDAVARQVSVLQELASEASAAATAFESLGESLRDAIDGLSDDISNPMEDFLKHRASFNKQFSLAMKGFDADSQEAMGELSGIAEDMLEAAKQSMGYEEYQLLKARTVSRLGKAATRAELQGEYGAVASDLYTTESGLLSRVQEDLSSGTPNADFVAKANELFEKLSLVSDAAKSVAEGDMSESAFSALARKTESDLLSGANMKELLAGTLDLGNIDQNQARMLLSSVDALESLEKYTGHDVDLADKMRLQLETIAAGVTDQSQWSTLVAQIDAGQDEYISWLKTSIEERRKEADRLYALNESEVDSSERMEAYFKAVSQYLLKQTSIETISKQISTLNSQSASLSALANQAAIQATMTGNWSAFNQYMQQVQQINSQVSALQQQLNYWLNLVVDIPEFATGGIVFERTLATIGEAGPEAVVPLEGGAIPVHVYGGGGGASDELCDEVRAMRKELLAVAQEVAKNTRATAYHTYDTSRAIERSNLAAEAGTGA
jgi:hypothetical protein